MINQTLVEEVLRLKDAAIMFPQPPKKERILNIRETIHPPERCKSQMEWWLHIMNGGGASSITKYVKPKEEEKAPRPKLTQAQINTLKALSHKLKRTQGNTHTSFVAQAA